MKAEPAPLTQTHASLWDVAGRNNHLLLSASAGFSVPQPIKVLVGYIV